jgi:cell division protein FtsI/penicillin-binding protein 2
MMRNEAKGFSPDQFSTRLRFVLVLIVLMAVGLVARAVDLQLLDNGFLEKQGDARFTRVAKLSATRGAIYDRNGEAMAASTPVDTIWACPPELIKSSDQFDRLAEALNRDKKWLQQVVTSNLDREFVYLVRHMRPTDAAQVAAFIYCANITASTQPEKSLGMFLASLKNSKISGRKGLSLPMTDGWARSLAQNASSKIVTGARSRTSKAFAHPTLERISSLASI